MSATGTEERHADQDPFNIARRGVFELKPDCNINLGIGVPMGKRGLRQRDCIRVNAACCPSQEPLTEQQELRIREQQLREQASATSEQIEEATERSEKAIRKAERRAAKAERKARKAAERAQQEGDTASVVRAAADLLAVRY